jgi:hypothetical protein
MAVLTVARIQHRRGVKSDLPPALYEAELGFCLDTRELYIGNSVAAGGNTQILTNTSAVVSSIPYQFLSDTSVTSQTGSDPNNPVIRTLQQEIDDLWVNVKAYGAQGDGHTDDTDAINRAIRDLYTKTLTSQESEFQSQKAIWFPSGTYVITSALLVYPYVCLVGEHADTTKVVLTADGSQPAVITVVDSLGQTGASIGNNGATVPQYIQMANLTVSSTGDENLVLLQRSNHVQFRNCVFLGNWLPDDAIPNPAPKAVVIETLGSAIESSHFDFINCRFTQIPWAFNCEDNVNYVTFDGCEFSLLHLGIRTNNPPLEPGPSYATAVNCVFRDIESYGISWLSNTSGAGPGITSTTCRFVHVGYKTPDNCILWGPYSNVCSSIGDVFDLSLFSVPIADQGTGNMIVDAQYNNIITNVSVVNVDTTTPYNVSLTDSVIVAQPATAGGAITLNLPSPAVNGRLLTIKDGEGDASNNNIVVDPGLTASIESGGVGVDYVINTNWQSTSLLYNATLAKWLII